MTKRVINIAELAELLNTTPTAVRSCLQRLNFTAIPRPIKLGRRLVWPLHRVEAFLEEREQESERIFAPPRIPSGRKRGRPTKREQIEAGKHA